MKKYASFLAFILALVLVMTGCAQSGGTTTANSSAPSSTATESSAASTAETPPAEVPKPDVVKIGILQYDNTDASQIAINDYFTGVLAPIMNIEFIFSENITSAEQEIAFYEQVAAAGGKAINAFYQVASPEAIVAKLNETGLYYAMNGGIDPTLLDAFKAAGSDKWVAGFAGASDYDDMKAIAAAFLEKGDRSFTIATGAKDFGVKMFIDRYQGCVDAIDEWNAAHADDQASYTEFPGFPNDFATWSANVQQTIDAEPDAVLATFSGENLWATPIAQSGKDIDLGTLSALNDASVASLADGSLDILSARHPQAHAIAVFALYNAATVGTEWFEGETPATLPVFAPIFTPESNAAQYYDPSFQLFSEDDVKSVLPVYNPNATLADLKTMSEKTGLGLVK